MYFTVHFLISNISHVGPQRIEKTATRNNYIKIITTMTTENKHGKTSTRNELQKWPLLTKCNRRRQNKYLKKENAEYNHKRQISEIDH